MKQKKINIRWPFTKRKQATVSATPSTLTQGISELSTWYHSIDKLPLSRFIDCVVDLNLSALIISGFPSPDKLLVAWQNIQLEYTDAIGTSEHKLYLQTLWEYERTKARLKTIEDMVEILRKIYYADFLRILNKAGRTAFKLNWENQKEYQETLDKALRRTAGIRIDLQLKEIEIEELQPKGDGNTKVSRQYYQQALITLSDHAKYPIHDSITVFEFCDRMRRFTAYCESVEKARQ